MIIGSANPSAVLLISCITKRIIFDLCKKIDMVTQIFMDRYEQHLSLESEGKNMADIERLTQDFEEDFAVFVQEVQKFQK